MTPERLEKKKKKMLSAEERTKRVAQRFIWEEGDVEIIEEAPPPKKEKKA